jgi:2-oxoisovalerate dehydrogenase E1 component alpha subunit
MADVNERNHIAHINTTQAVNIITQGLLDIPMLQLLDADGKIMAQQSEQWDSATAVRIFHAMQYTRLLDERMVNAQRQGRISFYLACTGEEAAVVGATAGCEAQDMIMSQYREQGALVYRGYKTSQFMDQLFSNVLDPNKGRQMPIHYGDKTLNFMTVSSPLGTQIPQAAGYAYGQRMAGQDAITLCFFGEGAASEGDFHAGLNMAAVLHCPTIFFCRNNGYAISTPTREQFAGDGIASRGIGYGVPTIRVDGNDALAVYTATRTARALALKESCPVLIEAMTYRLAAHSTSDDPASYRSAEEEAKWQAKDPLARLQKYLLLNDLIEQTDIDAYLEATRAEILREVKRAEKAPKAPIDDLFNDVYATPPMHLQQQLASLKSHIAAHPTVYPTAKGDA